MPKDHWSLIDVLIMRAVEGRNLVRWSSLQPTNANMPRIPCPTVGPHYHTRVSRIAIVARRDHATALLEQCKILLKAVLWKISWRRISKKKGFSGFNSPTCHSLQMPVSLKHISQLFKSLSICIEVLEQLAFLRWSGLSEKNQNKQNPEYYSRYEQGAKSDFSSFLFRGYGDNWRRFHGNLNSVLYQMTCRHKVK